MVSIIIPAYRASAYIDATLASVFDQHDADIEVIVVNDGSPDTPQLIAALSPWRERIVYLEQPNRGAGAARNAGRAAARGDLVAFLDADDRWLPGFLAGQRAFLEAHPDCDLVYTDARLTGDTPLAGRSFMQTAPSDGPVTFRSLVSQQCTVLTSSVVARRGLIEKVGGFDPAIRRGQDFDLWLRLAHAGARIAYQRTALVERVVLADGLSADSVTEMERALRVLGGLRAKIDLKDDDLAALGQQVTRLEAGLERERGKRLLRLGRCDAARRHLQRSMALEPGWKLRAVVAVLAVAPGVVRRAYMRLRPPTAAEMLAIGS